MTFTEALPKWGAYTVGNPGGEPTSHPDIPLPPVSALAFYKKAPGQDEAAMVCWWDLCPDGMVRTWSASDRAIMTQPRVRPPPPSTRTGPSTEQGHPGVDV